MRVREKVFSCLKCGADTGCANKLVCDRCRVTAGTGRRASVKGRRRRKLPRRIPNDECLRND